MSPLSLQYFFVFWAAKVRFWVQISVILTEGFVICRNRFEESTEIVL
jgi:hypothetical protein